MPGWIDGDRLAEIIKSDKVPAKDYLIVDVRDDDYVGGNIPGGQNWPAHNYMWQVNDLVEKSKGVGTIIFHCAQSQQRGPKAARIYEEVRNNLGGDTSQEILILRGGFIQFQAKFKDDPKLVENWDKNVWASEWS